MADQPSERKQGIEQAVEPAKRRTEKELANIDRSIQFRDELRSKDSQPPTPVEKKGGTSS